MNGQVMRSEPLSWLDYPTTQDDPVQDDADQGIASAGQPCLCTGCQAVEVDGRWGWRVESDNASSGLSGRTYRTVLCPACRRCREHRAAGSVSLEMTPSSQIESCLHEIIHAESRRMVEDDPMQRIIDIQRQENSLLVSTTTMELARAIGEAVQRTMRGHLELHYHKTAGELRVRWLAWK